MFRAGQISAFAIPAGSILSDAIATRLSVNDAFVTSPPTCVINVALGAVSVKYSPIDPGANLYRRLRGALLAAPRARPPDLKRLRCKLSVSDELVHACISGAAKMTLEESQHKLDSGLNKIILEGSSL